MQALSKSARLVAAVLAIGAPVHGAWAQTLPAAPISPPSVTYYEYDAEGNSTRTIEGAGTPGLNFSTRGGYDTLNRLKDRTDAKLGKTQFEYDGLGRNVKVADPRNDHAVSAQRAGQRHTADQPGHGHGQPHV